VGDTIIGRIVRLTDFGAFVEIAEGVEGLVHVSELADERVEHPKDRFSVDQMVRAKVIKMDPAERKIGLSIKAAAAEGGEPIDLEAYRSGRAGGATIGDVVGGFGASQESDGDADEED
jgi:small subunit ribosomal protein S1